jgi:hypothetical protein
MSSGRSPPAFSLTRSDYLLASKDWKHHGSAITFNCLAPINLDDVDCKLIAN